jgi:DNA-binding transcriptional ArsR family regulator
MMSGTTEQAGGFCWAALVARLLHPVDVEIIEALRWIEQPLSADELSKIFDGKWSWAKVSHHIRRLDKLGAVELHEIQTKPNIADIRYRLVERPGDGG